RAPVGDAGFFTVAGRKRATLDRRRFPRVNTEDILVLLFCVATLIAIVVRRVRVPYTVALVLAGLAIGSLGWVEPPTLTRDMLFTFFLPGLLFEAAFHIDLEALRGTWRSVFCLS